MEKLFLPLYSIYLCLYGIMDIYFILWVINQWYFYFVAEIILLGHWEPFLVCSWTLSTGLSLRENLLSGTLRWSRPPCMFPCPRPRVNHFSKKICLIREWYQKLRSGLQVCPLSLGCCGQSQVICVYILARAYFYISTSQSLCLYIHIVQYIYIHTYHGFIEYHRIHPGLPSFSICNFFL